MRESTLVNKIQKYCKDNNIYCVKIWGGGYQSAGVPDLLICYYGHFIAMETKVKNNKTTPLQEYHINQIINSGGTAIVIRNLKEAINILQKVYTLYNKRDIINISLTGGE